MKRRLILCTLTAMIILASCKKDNTSNDTTAIEGTYKLMYLTAKTNATTTSTDGEKIVTTSDYTTINNQGTIVFNNSTLSATGLTYTVNTAATYYLYDGTDLLDSSSFPFTFTLPVSNSVGQYQLIGADSIYFPQGSLTSGVGGTGSIQSSASGGRYSWNGKLLTIIQTGSKDSTFQDSGETIHVNEAAVSSVVLEKQ